MAAQWLSGQRFGPSATVARIYMTHWEAVQNPHAHLRRESGFDWTTQGAFLEPRVQIVYLR